MKKTVFCRRWVRIIRKLKMVDSTDRGGEQPQIEMKEFLSSASWSYVRYRDPVLREI